MNLQAYRGNEPFIFASYAHRDEARVAPIFSRILKDGYRFWFDAGIDPGTEWDENIASHIKSCGYLIAFISKNYLASDNCKDELNYARDLNKKRLLVYLEDVTLPDGMAMRLNRLQAIFHHKYTDEENFFKELFQADGIAAFRDRAQEKQEMIPAPKKEEAKPPAEKPAPQAKGEIITFSDGATYEGEVDLRRLPHGRGIYRWANGAVYEGEFRNGMRPGRGLLRSQHGARSEGASPSSGKRTKGVYRWANGAIFEGEFQNEKRHGKGTYFLGNGECYEGEFREGEARGSGTYRYPDGRSFEGNFSSLKSARGTMRYPDGRSEDGTLENGAFLPL